MVADEEPGDGIFADRQGWLLVSGVALPARSRRRILELDDSTSAKRIALHAESGRKARFAYDPVRQWRPRLVEVSCRQIAHISSMLRRRRLRMLQPPERKSKPEDLMTTPPPLITDAERQTR